MSALTLLDIAKMNGSDQTVGLIEENIKAAPEAQLFPFRTIRGTSYKTLIRTGFPTTGFRAANEGQTPSKSSFRNELVQAYIFGGQIEVDKAVADADERGADHVQMLEASGVMESALRNLGKQVFYGVTQDAKGFPGLKAATPKGGTTDYGDNLTVNAAGTTASTASSVYAVKFGDQHCSLIGGNNSAFVLDDFMVQQVVDANDAKFTAYVAGLTAWIGMQVGNQNCVRRICNLTADSGKGLTDSLLAQLMATFPVGYLPDAIFMSRRSRSQLQTARTVTLFGQGKLRADQEALAPLPSSYDGVPIVVTDSILNTDAIEA